eukprot:jgi/Mesvir1/27443/Mv07229-RA.2
MEGVGADSRWGSHSLLVESVHDGGGREPLGETGPGPGPGPGGGLPPLTGGWRGEGGVMMLPGEAREFTPKERDHGHDRGSLDLEEDEDDESADSTGVPTLEDELYMGLPRRALFFLDLTNPVRHAAIRVVRSKLFERTILFIIMANCAFLAMSSNEPNFDNTTRGVILNKSEAVFTALFLAEMLLKVLAMGFVLDKGSYLREPWNVMDCVVVFLGLLAFIPSFGNYSAIRTVRVLRPLRTITGVEGMRVLVVTLLRSLPMLIDVLVLCAFAFFIFGIIGVQSFATKLRNRCGVESTSDNITFDYAINALNPDEVCSGPMAPLVGPDADRSWGKGYTCPAIGGVQLACFDGHENPNYGITNFDNILYAWLTIFQCISMEGWTDIMYLTQDATNSWVFLYFVVLIIFGSFFAVNLALAVLYMHFTDTATASHEASAAAAEEKRDTARAARKAMKAAGMNQSLRGSTPVPVTHHHNPISRTCRHVTQSRAFTYVMLFLILVNTAVMAMQYYGQSARMTRALNIINYFLTAAFALEMILKLIALGPRGYVRDKMNIFDGLVVFFSILEVCISTNGSLSVLRAFRLLRVFKLARSWKQLNSIINTIFRSVGSISYLSLILLLFIFVFALLGMQLFGYEFAFCDVGGKPMCPPGETCLGHLDCYEPCTPDQVGQYDPGGTGAFPGGFCERYPMSWVEGDPEPPGGVKYLTFVTHSYVPRANFDDIYWSIITIFQVLTGENWNEVMYNGIRSTGYPAAIYFLLLVLVGNYVILNLFLAILLDNFGGGGIQKDGAAEDSTACTPRAGDESTHGGDRGGYDSSRCTSLTDKKRQEKVVPQQDDKPGGGDPGMNCNNNKVIGTSVRDLLDPKTMAALSEEDITAVDEGSEKQASVMAPPSCPPLTIRTSVGVSRGGSTPSDETVRPLALVPAVLAVEDATPWADSPSSAAGQRPLLSRQHKVEYIEDVGELPVHGKKKSRHGQAKIVPNGNGMLAHHVEEGKGKAGEGVTAAVSPRLANGEKGGGFGQGVGSHKEDGHSKGSTPGHPDTRSPTGFFSPVASPRAFTPDGNSPSYAQMHGPSAPGSARQLYPARSFHSQRHNSPHAKQLRQKLLQQRTRFRMNLMPYPQHSSLYIFASTNPMRAALYKLICHRYFEIGIVLVIAASSIVLTLDSPRVDPDSTLVNVLDKLDLVFLILFIAECVIKIIVLGFVLHPGAYLRSAWNVLDFLIVVIGVVSRASGSSGRLSALRALRTFRALRPIRMASRAEGMKVVVNALFQAIPSIGNVLLVCALFYLIFGILGMDLLAGRLQYCEDVNGVTVEAGSPLKPASWPGVVINRTWCETGPHLYNITREGATVPAKVFVVETHWHNRETNFDNIGHAALALFEMASLEGWLYIMYSGVDAVGVEAQPRRNGNQYVAAYFVVFIIVGCFFVMNLFVGVTIDKFNEIKEKQEGQSVFLTPEQRNWVTIQKLLVGIKPIRCRIAPVSNIHRICYDFVSSDYFETGILGVIILNVIMMSMQHADMTPAWEAAMIYSNLAFCVIFTIEAALKLYGFSPAVYFKENWNRFDFGVVILTILSTLFDMLQGNRLPVISLIRVLRVVRIFRLVPRARGLRTLFQTLVFSLPALVNVGSVLSLFFFIFSIMGMNLFGQIKHGDYVTRHANFETFPNAMLLLFRMSTGENWNGVMHDCMITRACIQVYPPFIDSLCGGREYVNRGDACLKGLDEDRDFINRCSPHPSVAIFFFIIFIVLCAFVMLNLVIAVILDNFHSSSVNEEAPVSREHMQRFADVWSILDPRATYYISTRQLQDLIRELDPPLGTRGIKVSTSDVQRIIMSVDIPEHRGRVHFLEVLHALAGRVAGTEYPFNNATRMSPCYVSLPRRFHVVH